MMGRQVGFTVVKILGRLGRKRESFILGGFGEGWAAGLEL